VAGARALRGGGSCNGHAVARSLTRIHRMECGNGSHGGHLHPPPPAWTRTLRPIRQLQPGVRPSPAKSGREALPRRGGRETPMRGLTARERAQDGRTGCGCFDDLAGEGEPVDDGGAEPWVGEGLVQPEKASLEAIAIAERSSRSVSTWNSGSAPRRSSSMCRVGEEAPCTVAGVGFLVPARRTGRARWPSIRLSV
jgi:hypothetical protein